MPAVRQASFAAGELSPSLYGRTDLARFANGARRIFNAFVAKHGSIVSRAGTQFLGTAWNGMVDTQPGGPLGGSPSWSQAGDMVRTIPFTWSDTDTSQNYVLELGERYFRVWKNGVPLINQHYTAPAGSNWASGTTYLKGAWAFDPNAPQPTIASMILDSNVLGLWKNDELSGTAVADAAGNYPLTAGPSTSIIAGRLGNARSFTGAGNSGLYTDFIYGPADATMATQLSTGDFTVEAWVRPNTSGGDANGTVFSLDRGAGGATSGGLLVVRSAGQNFVSFYDTGVGNPTDNTTPFADGSWTHIAARLTGTTLDLFVNGVKVKTVINTTRTTFGAGFEILMGNRYTNTNRFKGDVDEVRVSKVARTDNEIATSAAMGLWFQSLAAGNLAHVPHSSPTWWVAVTDFIANSTPYSSAILDKIRLVQSGDILYLACAGYPPATITRGEPGHLDENHWVYAAINFARPPPSPALSVRLQEDTYGAVDATHPAKLWRWAVTEISRDANGLLSESAPVYLDFGIFWNGVDWNPNVPFKVRTIVKRGLALGGGPAYWTCISPNTGIDPTGGSGAASWFIYPTAENWDSSVTWPVYAVTKHNGVFYECKLQHANHEPPNATYWTPLAGDLLNGGFQQDDLTGFTDVYVCLYPDRQLKLWLCPASTVAANFINYRVYRGNGKQLGWIGNSIPGPLTSQSTQLFTDDGRDPDYSQAPPQGISPFDVFDPTTGALTRTETPIAVTFFEDRLMFCGTPQRPTFIFGSATGDYYNFDQRLITTDDESVVFALAARKREMILSAVGLEKLMLLTDAGVWAAGGAGGALSPSSIDAHLQADIGSDWAAPLIAEGSILWVRNKGAGVRQMSFDLQRGHFISGDLSMASEHLLLGHKIRDWCITERPWGVVWAIRDDGVVLSLTYSPDDQLWAWAQHAVCIGNDGVTPGVTQSVCTIPEGDEDVLYMAMTGNAGAAWIMRMPTRLEIAGIKTPVCLDAYVQKTGSWGRIISLTGLDHLEGRPVWVMGAPEGPLGPYTVTAGAISAVRGPPGAYGLLTSVNVGLPYNVEVELLDMPQERTRQKVVTEVGLELKGTGQVYAGADFNHLNPQTILTNDPLVVRVPVLGDWNSGGRAALRRVVPLPLTVLGVTREVATGEG